MLAELAMTGNSVDIAAIPLLTAKGTLRDKIRINQGRVDL